MFQGGVDLWMQQCFGPEISGDKTERNFRFGEEALELMQANDCTKEEAHALVEYVFNRPKGEVRQEVGGVMVCLAALCNALNIDLLEAGTTELSRCWEKIDKIRAKHAAKPEGVRMALPGQI